MAMDGIRLAMEDTHFRRGDAVVLRGITWRVRQGEHWAVVGPNGSGKTTLMMIATGYLPSSGGRTYLIDGWMSEIVLPDVRRRLGFFSASLTDTMMAHHAHARGLDVVLSGRHASLGLYRGPTEDEVEEARRILQWLGGEHLAEVRFGVMSTGQRQICLVGRCHMARSDLVILDEPCAGLDIAARERVLAALERTCRRPEAPPHVLITHHPQEIVPSVTHVLLLHGGRAVAQGPKEQVLTEEHLSATFGLPLRVHHDEGRVWVSPRGNLGTDAPWPGGS